MDFDKFYIRVRQMGGFCLLWEYIKLGVLWPSIWTFFLCIVRKQSFKNIYPKVLKRIEPYLQCRYKSIMEQKVAETKSCVYKHAKSNIIWFCWLQGMEQAPEIIQSCYFSLEKYLEDREIRVIDLGNWEEYIKLPEYIKIKWERGRIPAANFSDLLRLELLIQYGGTWIDSTVLCTGKDNIRKFLDADLFVFQYTRPGTVEGISISNWFISAHSNNEVLIVLRDMLFEYWKDYNCTLDYYIFHFFFSLIAKEFPEEIGAMPYANSQKSIALMYNWNKTFNHAQWNKLISCVKFHKLSYRISDKVKNKKDNYYNWILNKKNL